MATNWVFTRSICWVGMFSSLIGAGFRGAGALRRMLSSESLLFALKSGCLNSHAYQASAKEQQVEGPPLLTHPNTVRRMPALFGVLSDLVEVIFVELSDETGKIAVFEVFRQDGLGESLILGGWSDIMTRKGEAVSRWGANLEHDKALAVITPSHHL